MKEPTMAQWRDLHVAFSEFSRASHRKSWTTPTSASWTVRDWSYQLGLRIKEGWDQLRLVTLDGWEESEGVRIELERAWELDIPVNVVNPDTYEVLPREMTCVSGARHKCRPPC